MRGITRVLTAECVDLYLLLLQGPHLDQSQLVEHLRALEAKMGAAGGPLGLHAWWDVAEPVQERFPGVLDES
jgi:hypothetical protein